MNNHVCISDPYKQMSCLEPGQMFTYKGMAYMRVENNPVTSSKLKPAEGFPFPAVDLRSGVLEWFEGECMVKLVDRLEVSSGC